LHDGSKESTYRKLKKANRTFESLEAGKLSLRMFTFGIDPN